MNCGVTLQHAAVACASGPARWSSSLLTMYSQLGMQQELELNNSMQTEGIRALQAAVRDAFCRVVKDLLPNRIGRNGQDATFDWGRTYSEG